MCREVLFALPWGCDLDAADALLAEHGWARHAPSHPLEHPVEHHVGGRGTLRERRHRCHAEHRARHHSSQRQKPDSHYTHDSS